LGIRFFERSKTADGSIFNCARGKLFQNRFRTGKLFHNRFRTGSSCGIWVRSAEFEIAVQLLQLKEHWVPHVTQGSAFKNNMFCPE